MGERAMRPGAPPHVDDRDLRDVLAQIERATSVDPELGELVADRYRILELLAEGGMGRVYVGEHVELGLPVAIKLLPVGTSDERVIERFRREAVAAAQLRSPHVVQVFDFGRTRSGAFYLVMELLEGRDLATLLAHDGPPGAARSLDLLRQVARALDHAHAHGIVHRDLKPENVFVVEGSCYTDYAKVLDFGVAKRVLRGSAALTEVGTVLGTPAYMAPEQASADAARIGPASDRYALAAVALELLTGGTPYPDDHPLQTLRALVEQEPRMPSALGLEIERLDALFARALARDPGARFVSASGFVEALAVVLGDAPIEALELHAGRRTSMIRSLAPRARRVPSEAPTMIGRPTPPTREQVARDGAATDPDLTTDALTGSAAPPVGAVPSSVPPPPARPPITMDLPMSAAADRPRLDRRVALPMLAIGLASFAAGWVLAVLAGLPG